MNMSDVNAETLLNLVVTPTKMINVGRPIIVAPEIDPQIEEEETLEMPMPAIDIPPNGSFLY